MADTVTLTDTVTRTAVTRHTSLYNLPELCRVEEVAAYLGVGRGIVYAMVRRGELPSVRLGRLLRIKRDGLVTQK